MPKVTTDFEHGEAQIFKNPFLESLTKTNPTSNIIVNPALFIRNHSNA